MTLGRLLWQGHLEWLRHHGGHTGDTVRVCPIHLCVMWMILNSQT